MQITSAVDSRYQYCKTAEHRSPGLTPVTWTPYIYYPVDYDPVKMGIVAKILNFN